MLLLLSMTALTVSAQKQFVLEAPNGKLKATVTVGKTDITYSVSHNGDVMVAESPLSMTLTDGTAYGINPKLSKSSQTSINNVINAPVYKRSKILDNYNELTLQFRGNYSIVFRAYNEGVAYRFVSTSKKPFMVESEQVVFNFPANNKVYVPYVRKQSKFENQFFNSFESTYDYISLSQWDKERLAFAPVLVEGANGKKVCITDADLMNYPGMYLHNADGSNTLKGVFAPYPRDIKQGGHNELQGLVQSRESYIAKFDNGTSFPWRVVIVSENDAQLADNDMVYKLATPTVDMDFSWVKPGKVAWEWWNAWNLYGVDFRAGINNDTYKYYIDFAADHGIEYVILDEGWAVNKKADLMQVIPEIDLKALVAHADRRGVGLILWAGYLAFERDMEEVCRHYSEMGIKGFKVDFMDRDDQAMVDFHRRGAEIAAKYKLMLDYHGTYKPTGLHRTYPNVINFEGVFGLEQMKWSAESVDMVTYDVTIPFIRMVAGPLDYTQGAMRNARKGNYRPVNNEAMSQGTRCRQLAEYVIFESPLNMLCDSPSNYMREAECTEFIATVPTVWDNSMALNGEVGKYVTIARQKGNAWYIGSLTNWDAREMELDLAFLGEGDFKAEVFRDGINADRAARDYVKETIDLSIYKKIKIKMAPGGGFVMKITRK